MGRRLVYGQLADGPFRHELNANSLKVISDALQRPAASNIDPEKYANKVPAIEIFQGDTLLFREERDGTVTVNEIHFQVEQEGQSGQKAQTVEVQSAPVPEAAPAIAPAAEPSHSAHTVSKSSPFTVNKADQILRTAEYLINPLRQEKGLYDAVSIRGYQIKQSDQHITVSKGDQLILVARGGEVVSDQVAEQDWAVLSQIQVPERFPQPEQDIIRPPQTPQFQTVPIAAESPHATNGAVPAGVQIIEPSQQAAEQNNGRQGAAFSVLERETQKLPESPTRRLLQETIQGWKQQLGQWVSAQVQKGMNFLRNQRSVLQNQQLASAVQQLFQRGYERTGEHSYSARGCTITRESQNLYVLKDAAGELMKFKASEFSGLGRRVEVLSVSDRLTSQQRQELLSAHTNQAFSPQSSLDVEATYAKKTRQVENTTRQFLKDFVYANVWSKEGGQFKMEVGKADLLRITDKQNGRGVVFQRQNGEVFSKLNGQDFEHFERLTAKMEGMASRQSQSATNNSKKASAIEMD